jgi:hypothetical protein
MRYFLTYIWLCILLLAPLPSIAVENDALTEAEAKAIVDNLKKEMEDVRKVRKQTILEEKDMLPQKDTTLFKYVATPSFTLSQTNYTLSWQDGVNSIGFRATLSGYGHYMRRNFFVRFTPDIAYSRASEHRVTEEKSNSVKKEDRLALNLSGGRRLFQNNRLFLSGQLDLKTQFDKGEGQLISGERGTVSKFFAPAYLVGSLGLRYSTPIHIKVNLSPISGRFTFVTDTSLSRYVTGMMKDDVPLAFKAELGAYAEIIYDHKLLNNISIVSRLELFSNYQDNPQNIDVDWQTTIDFKISKWFSIIFYNRILYRDKSRYYKIDHDTGVSSLHGPDIQWNESLNVGITYTFSR